MKKNTDFSSFNNFLIDVGIRGVGDGEIARKNFTRDIIAQRNGCLESEMKSGN